jgi:hypothetical protein
VLKKKPYLYKELGYLKRESLIFSSHKYKFIDREYQ